MKKFTIAALGIGLLIGNVYAQDVANTIHSSEYIKDYFEVIKTESSLKKGLNSINIDFKHNSHTHNDLNTKLTIYSPNGKSIDYVGVHTKKNGQYQFKVNLPEKGDYGYVLNFSHTVGMTHTKRGSFNL